MRTRGRFPRAPLLFVAALFGAGVVVLPAVAVSETGSFEAVDSKGVYGEHHSWSPPEVTVGQGGVVTIKNPSATVAHGVQWVGAAPACSGVPGTAGQPVSATSWAGTCTFSRPGAYTFYCTVHGKEMTGVVSVSGGGTTTVSTTTQTNPSPPGSTTSTGPGGSTAPSLGAAEAGPAAASAGVEAVRITPSQRGKAVRGSLAISPAGAGARLEVELLTSAATLASAGHSAPVRVGRLVRPNLQPGTASFSVPLNARARGALHRHGHLALRVRLTVKAASGAAAVISRRVTVHR
jgi:plastocyanin